MNEFFYKGLANSFNGAYLDQDSEWIYYCNPLDDNAILYKIKKDMTDKIKLYNKKVSNITIYNDFIYFSQDTSIFKINKDGCSLQEIINTNIGETIYEMCIYNDYIYYTDDLPYGSLYKIKIDGSNKIKVSNNSPMYLNIYNNYIYYAGQDYTDDSTGIYKIDLNGNDEEKILNGDIDSLNIYNNNIYFTNSVDNSNLFKMSVDCKTKNIILNKKVSNLNIFKDWMYYIDVSDNDSLYKLKLDGTEVTKLEKSLCTNILVFSDYIYYEDILKEKIFQFNMSNKTKISL